MEVAELSEDEYQLNSVCVRGHVLEGFGSITATTDIECAAATRLSKRVDTPRDLSVSPGVIRGIATRANAIKQGCFFWRNPAALPVVTVPHTVAPTGDGGARVRR